MEITKFNEINVKFLRIELEKTLNEFASKYGLKVSELGTIKYSDNILHTSKISFAPNVTQIPTNAPLNSYIGQKYKRNNTVFTIIKIDEEGRLIAVTNRNATYVITREQIKGMIRIL